MGIEENIAKEFDVFALDYTEDMMRCVPHYLKLVSSIGEYLPSSKGVEKILDLGCGNGNVIQVLLTKFPNAEYTLVDASAEMLNICEQRFPHANLRLIESYFEQFDFTFDYYDLVTASFSFHHLDSKEKKWIFKKSFDALKQGGTLSSADLMINKKNPDHQALLKEWGDFVKSNYSDTCKWEWLMEHYETFDKPDNYWDQMEWLEQAGFSSVEVPWSKGYWANIRAIK